MELTESANEVLEEITEDSSVPDTAGLRISAEDEGGDKPALAAALTSEPGPQDAVLEFEHGRVFLDPAVADRLADRILDAEVGADDEVVFHVRRHTEDTENTEATED